MVNPLTVSVGELPSQQVVVEGWDSQEVSVGDRFSFVGVFDPDGFRIRRDLVSGTVDARDIIQGVATNAPHIVIANQLRRRILGVIEPDRSEGRALLAGFLIGDTTQLGDLSLDSMRRAGLTHYVAVSGSNVALFLMLWWVLLAPLRLRPSARVLAGLAGLAVFAAMTRWEPSVIRASVAAAILLVSRGLGVSLSTWSILATAVVGCLVFAGELATDVGFQLSVLATLGVLSGASIWTFRPRMVSGGLSAALAAQVMVAPVLIATFGSLPLLSPIANVVAGPLVVGSTAAGGVGALLGLRPLVEVGSVLASGVLGVAEVAAPWPQIDWRVGLLLVGGGTLVWLGARPLLIPIVACLIAVVVWPQTSGEGDLPAVAFLDIGQGDAALVMADGFTMLIDGGPDPVVLERKLDRYGVRSIDVLVISHVHSDHITGLGAVIGQRPVGLVVADFQHHSTAASEWLVDEAERLGITMAAPVPGMSFGASDLNVEFVGPTRRYASPNDESVVLVVTLGDDRVLFPGDVEVHAQTELEVPDIAVLKVPHQGAGTSDPAWLERHAGRIAVVSVGPNPFGHPAEWVIETLEQSGAAVHRTDLDGDLVYSATGR